MVMTAASGKHLMIQSNMYDKWAKRTMLLKPMPNNALKTLSKDCAALGPMKSTMVKLGREVESKQYSAAATAPASAI